VHAGWLTTGCGRSGNLLLLLRRKLLPSDSLPEHYFSSGLFTSGTASAHSGQVRNTPLSVHRLWTASWSVMTSALPAGLSDDCHLRSVFGEFT
jgi:hypothetical protein